MKRALAGRASVPFDVPEGHHLRRHRRRDRQARHAALPAGDQRGVPRRHRARRRSATCTARQEGQEGLDRQDGAGRSPIPPIPPIAPYNRSDEPGSLRRRRRRARARRAGGARHDRLDHRLDAAARRRQDARLRRRPDRRHDRRRLLRERRVREGARGDPEPPAPQLVHYELSRRLRAGDRPRSAADRWTSTSSRSSRRPSSTSSAPATSASISRGSRSEVGFRVHVVDDREKFANAERFPTAGGDRRRRHPGLARAHDAFRRTPTSSS